MFKRLKNSKTMYLVLATILSTVGGMMLPDDHEMYLGMMEGVQIIIASLGLLFMRDGIAK